MKSSMNTLIYSLGAALVAAPLPSPAAPSAVLAGAESRIQGAEIRACDETNTRCLVVHAGATIGSQVSALHRMKNPALEYTDKRSGKTEKIQGTSGYIDFDNNNLVVYVRTKKTLSEIEFNLKTLNRYDRLIR